MSERGEECQPTPDELTRTRVAMYRDAARGCVDIHTLSINGNTVLEHITEPGEPFPADLLEKHTQRWELFGGPAELKYTGIIGQEACATLADNLEAQLATGR